MMQPLFEKNLPDSFFLLTRIVSRDRQRLAAEASFDSAPAWLLFEACAQAAAMHQRLLTDFRDHAFLLSAGSVPLDIPKVSGTCLASCSLEGSAGRAAVYTGVITQSGKEILRTERLIIGHAPYGEAFDGRRLAAHYREAVRWLTR